MPCEHSTTPVAVPNREFNLFHQLPNSADTLRNQDSNGLPGLRAVQCQSTNTQDLGSSREDSLPPSTWCLQPLLEAPGRIYILAGVG